MRALALEFKTDTVFIVGSQAILASMSEEPEAATESPEIDAFPANAKVYIDGVDETTAKLPRGWRHRAVTVQTEVEGRTVIGVAPAPEDLVVSKIARLDERDKRFVGAIHETHPLDLELIEQRVQKPTSIRLLRSERSPISEA